MIRVIFLILAIMALCCKAPRGDNIVGTFEIGDDQKSQRIFGADSTYARRNYNSQEDLAYVVFGHWRFMDGQKYPTILIMLDSAKSLDSASGKLLNSSIDVPELRIAYRRFSSTKIDFFQEATEVTPAQWETWRRIF